MKMLWMIVLAVGLVSTVQAQEKVKNSYVDKGDVIEATLFHEDGTVSQTGFYTKEGKLTGEWISFNRSGDKTATAQYDNGNKVGTWFFWNQDILTEVTYTNSKIATVNTWKNEGTRVVSNE